MLGSSLEVRIMPQAVPFPVRQALQRGHNAGIGSPALARLFGLARRTVYHLLHQTAQHHGQVQPLAYRPPPQGPHADDLLVAQARALRQQHPDWGCPLIRLVLAEHFPQQSLPCSRTLQRWLQQAQLPRPPLGRPASVYHRASAVHQSWQCDAADQLRLASGELVSWLRILDECSGAVLQTTVFALVWNKVPARQTQAALRQAFIRWGLPERLRLDNGLPWGNWNDLPTALALWLSGLGVQLLFNPPGKPQHNGVVEKSQDTGQRWSEPQTAATVAELQQRLEEMDRVQREVYPSFHDRSRWQVFPQLVHSGRAYSRRWEERSWDLKRAQQYLAQHVGCRRVSKQGHVSVYNRPHYVGVAQQGKRVYVQYDANQRAWLFSDQQGRQLRQLPAPEICRQRILAVDVSAP